MNTVLSIALKINQPKNKKKYNILTGATHEGYQTLLSQTDHNFYLIKRPKSKEWNTEYRPLPDNHYEINQLNPDLNIDFILAQEKFGFLQYAINLQKITRWPIISLEHTQPQDRWSDYYLNQLKMLGGDINVFITEFNKKSWEKDNGIIINHGIDADIFKGWCYTGDSQESKYILYVVNHLKERDYFCGYNEWLYIKNKIQEKYPDIEFRLVGNNVELGQPAQNMDDLIKQYQNCVCYLNTSKLSPIPMSLLEAMSVGCPIVTTANQEVPNVVDGVGICNNNLDYLIEEIENIINNRDLRGSLSNKARTKILDDFNIEQFISNWNNVFDMAYKMRFGSICINW